MRKPVRRLRTALVAVLGVATAAALVVGSNIAQAAGATTNVVFAPGMGSENVDFVADGGPDYVGFTVLNLAHSAGSPLHQVRLGITTTGTITADVISVLLHDGDYAYTLPVNCAPPSVVRQNTMFRSCTINSVAMVEALPVGADMDISIEYHRQINDPTFHPPVTVRYTGYDAAGTSLPMSNGRRYVELSLPVTFV
jgi:hypothetical protein